LHLNLFPAHIVAHCFFRAFCDILANDNFLGDPGGLVYHGLFCRLMYLDGALLEGARWYACFARHHWPPAFNANGLIAKRDALFDRRADDVAADAGRSAIDCAFADLKFFLGKRDDFLVLAAFGGAGSLGG
jgi:hypothetical protein